MKTLILFITLSLVSTGAMAIECRRVGHNDGQLHEIGALINNYTHIELPENVMKKTKPIVGNNELWAIDHAGPHIYIKPTSELKLGESTSLSAVGASGKSYDFKVVRRDQLKSLCFKLAEGSIFSRSEKEALTKPVSQNAHELAGLWKEKYQQQTHEFNDEKKAAVLDALRRYRYQIYTRYDWSKGRGFIGKNLISDVYDDGRFTYIRVNNQNKGLLMVEASLEGQTEIIEAKYDTLNQMYTISGIFPKFTLKYGKAKLKVKRADNTTVGEY